MFSLVSYWVRRLVVSLFDQVFRISLFSFLFFLSVWLQVVVSNFFLNKSAMSVARPQLVKKPKNDTHSCLGDKKASTWFGSIINPCTSSATRRASAARRAFAPRTAFTMLRLPHGPWHNCRLWSTIASTPHYNYISHPSANKFHALIKRKQLSFSFILLLSLVPIWFTSNWNNGLNDHQRTCRLGSLT